MISDFQVERNLRRTANKGLISLLHKEQMEQLALKYFGVKNETGSYESYICPYSGKKINSVDDLILEHIIPVSSNGGTVLFNCIPASTEVNGKDEKGGKHLIEWWTNSKYWDEGAPKRLEKLVNYMLEGYEQVFNEYTPEEIDESHFNFIGRNKIHKDDLRIKEQDNDILKEQSKNNHIHSYLGFLIDCIDELKNNNINTDEIEKRIKILKYNNIFENIEQYTKVYRIIKKIIIEIIGDFNGNYLTYSLNINIDRLINSIDSFEEQDIYLETLSRIENIKKILNDNNLSINDYFRNMPDIENQDLLYKTIDSINLETMEKFVESIKIGYDSKIIMFIDMLNHGNMDILMQHSKVCFTKYKQDDNGNNIPDKEYGRVNRFWDVENNRKRILALIEQNPEKNKVAIQTINSYLLRSSNTSPEAFNKKAEVFLEMLKNEKNIVSMLNYNSTVPYKTYKKNKNGEIIVDKIYDSLLGQFWSNNKDKLLPIIESNKELRIKMDNYYFNTVNGQNSIEGKERRREVFLDMLNRDLDLEEIYNLLKTISTESFTVFNKEKDNNSESIIKYGEIGRFWSNRSLSHRNYIIKKIKEDPIKYSKAINNLCRYYKLNTFEDFLEFENKVEEFRKLKKNNNINTNIEIQNIDTKKTHKRII